MIYLIILIAILYIAGGFNTYDTVIDSGIELKETSTEERLVICAAVLFWPVLPIVRFAAERLNW